MWVWEWSSTVGDSEASLEYFYIRFLSFISS
jgi:hypothetical protein